MDYLLGAKVEYGKVAMRRLSVRLPDHLVEELKEEAKADHVSFAEAFRRRLRRSYLQQPFSSVLKTEPSKRTKRRGVSRPSRPAS
jgi:hypothetical protein